MKAYFRTIFSSYAEIFFLPSAVLGFAICAVTFIKPGMALAGIIAVLAAHGCARLVRMEKQFLESGYYTYNPLLVGLSLGCLFHLNPVTIFFIIASGVLAFLATVFLANVFQTYLRLPILSLPFVIVSSLAYLASFRYHNLLLNSPGDSALMTNDFGLPVWAAGFFKSFGAVLFAPSVIVGVVLSLTLLRWSRILLLLAALGYGVGALTRTLMLGNADAALTDLNNFNFIFIAMALGGVFLIPSPVSYLIAAVAVAISTVFLDAVTGVWSNYGLPVFTLPFNVVCLGLIYVLGLLRHPLVATNIGRTPEETLENHLANRLRYPGKDLTLHLPFAGKWTVWQAFDGAWTHKGSWRYAYDFVITDDKGETHTGDGSRLENYYCYKKPVLSPVRGRVVQIVDDIPDSPPGTADTANNWGNLVVIQDARGFFVELSHLAEKSVAVKEGQWIERGVLLGLCGNSGYSPQPHIHVQAQATDAVGAATLPFSFVSYTGDNEFHSNNLPALNSAVEPLFPDKRLDNITNFVLDDELRYEVRRGDKPVGELKLKVQMAVDGTFYLQGERGQLFFGKHEGTFYFYRVTGNDPWLRRLFLALPRLPLAYRENLTWHDFVPVGLVTDGAREAIVSLLSSFYSRFAVVPVTQKFVSDNAIELTAAAGLFHRAQTALVELDRRQGFASVRVNDVELRRIETND